MFVAERWAQAFINVLGEEADEGCAVFQALLPGLTGIKPAHTGGVFARHLEELIRSAMDRAGQRGRGAEYACRLAVLLARKHCLKYAALLGREIALVLDRRRGIMPVVLEVPFSPDEELRGFLEGTLRKKLGKIRLDTRIVPELIGGCRVRMGSDLFDASIEGQLKKMAADLGALPFAGASKEGDSW
jgi:F-type H+-transporting ATPase subunit delta